MKCECGNSIVVSVGSKVITKGCVVLTAMTVIVTVKCSNCGRVFQIPVKSSGFAKK